MKYIAKQSYERMNRDHQDFIERATNHEEENKERGDFSKTDEESVQNKRL